MVLPFIPIAAAGLGIGAGFGLGNLFGGTKKEQAATSGAVYHAPYETYVPISAQQYQYAPQYGVQIDSPGASVIKKDVLTAQTRQAADLPQTYQTGTGGGAGGSATAGTDMTKLAIIGVIGLVAYGVVSKKK